MQVQTASTRFTSNKQQTTASARFSEKAQLKTEGGSVQEVSSRAASSRRGRPPRQIDQSRHRMSYFESRETDNVIKHNHKEIRTASMIELCSADGWRITRWLWWWSIMKERWSWWWWWWWWCGRGKFTQLIRTIAIFSSAGHLSYCGTFLLNNYNVKNVFNWCGGWLRLLLTLSI